jgi:integrase
MNKNTPFKDFAAKYIEQRQHELRSINSVASVMQTLSSYFGKKQIGNIKRIDISKYIEWRLGLGITPNTVNTDLAILSSAYNYVAHKWEIELANPVPGQRLPASPFRVRYLTKAESENLCESATDIHPLLRPFIELALNTGCRKTELMKIRLTDIDPERRIISLRSENTKTHRPRMVPLNSKALKALEKLQHWQSINRVHTEWLFANRDGSRLTRLSVPFSRARARAGITDFTIHDLRHTFASWLVMSGVELIRVRDLLGHTSIRMTERYAHLSTDALFEAVNVLERF